jgi:hypothetical protein
MPTLAYKPDIDRAMERMNAWWNRAILDRATIQVTAPKPGGKPAPSKQHPTVRDRWLDVEHNVACQEAWMSGTYYAGESLPMFFPNLGPEVMTAALGAELVFTEETSWSEPILHDWADVPTLRTDLNNFYLQKILEMTRLGLEVGKGKFLTGIMDLHPGGDLAASLRDPQQLCVDCIEEPEQVARLMEQLRPTFYECYELQDRLIRDAGQTITTSWVPVGAEGRYYIPSNDFSCMVSVKMMRDLFLQEIIEECEWLDRSIYHLDGPTALHHLDALLEIEALDGIQFVYGAGNEPSSRWMHVYKKVQDAGKSLWIYIAPDDLEAHIEALRPEGVMLSTWAGSVEEADAMIRRVEKWTR